ncbi:hypothetical protein Bpfe_028201, partial [Biomphalaria pfeifferi]
RKVLQLKINILGMDIPECPIGTFGLTTRRCSKTFEKGNNFTVVELALTPGSPLLNIECCLLTIQSGTEVYRR